MREGKILNAYWAVAGNEIPTGFIASNADNDTPIIYLRPSVLDDEILNKLTKVLQLNNKAQKYRGEMISAYVNKSIKKSSKFNKFKMADTDGISLQWKEELRSFGSTGSQSYWIQMMREMYDVIRIRNVRLTTEQLKAGSNNNNNNNDNNNNNNNKKIRRNLRRSAKEGFGQKDISSLFANIKLGDNLGVTEYGYQCRDPLNPIGQSWIPSYHRFGRAWYCSDVTPDKYQLPFGVYKDICAPPRAPHRRKQQQQQWEQRISNTTIIKNIRCS